MHKALTILVASLIIFNAIITPCFADPMRKLGRGIANTLTGVVEIPKQVYQVSKEEHIGKGITWGFLRGLGLGIARTAVGLYEVVTFPFPQPADYEPIIDPEFVFDDWAR
ncbi:MAG: exosortase system-associated protein, TIGR04073 family [Omnitrophica bacterium]|nr:exosortase system-associated protein, TIGR04073 family [Candidatus Omnitrophota bacterium]